MITRVLLTVLAITFLPACSMYRINSEDVSTNYHESKQGLWEVSYVDTVTVPHEVIGFVTVNAERNQKMEEIIAKMKKEAATLGGDAITNITSNATGTWKKIPPQKLIGNAYVRANFSATVVAYQ